jgi:hypothetical protein
LVVDVLLTGGFKDFFVGGGVGNAGVVIVRIGGVNLRFVLLRFPVGVVACRPQV